MKQYCVLVESSDDPFETALAGPYDSIVNAMEGIESFVNNRFKKQITEFKLKLYLLDK